ncbi:hypothetical protein [Flavobacterium terrae]|uniref:Uncharacterized protein n=1 Tax=Flavobacterium terrae TaxID=415425 RepID=A0A1M6CVV1_9FLAO|nr:hypothetical protein [Flavobacterium terrae]SHI65013.1 hypothetical protein SAMN05444363_1119 [Flavobacterium terrae]
MRKIITAFAILLSCMAFSQIKVLPTTPLERLGRVGTNDVYIQKEGTQYTFFYKNIENKDDESIRNFTFKNIDNDFENFYKIIMDGFNANPIYDIKLELPNDYVWLHYTKTTSKLTVQFMTTNKVTSSTGVSEMMTIEDVKKLFEKS